MKAVCWMGKEKMQVHDVPDPRILNPRDAIIRITTTCICGSIQNGEIDPSFVISHRLPIDAAPEAYRMFRDKQDHCTKVVLKPWEQQMAA